MPETHRSVDVLNDLALQAGFVGAPVKRPDTVASIQPPTYDSLDPGSNGIQLGAESLDTKAPSPASSSSSHQMQRSTETPGRRPSQGDRTRLSPYESVALPPSLSGRRPATTSNVGGYRRPTGHSPYDPVSLPPSLAGSIPRRPSTTEGKPHRRDGGKAHGRDQSGATSTRLRSNSQSRRSEALSIATSSPPPSPRSGRSQTRPSRSAAPQHFQRPRSHSRSRTSQPKDQGPVPKLANAPTTRRRAHSQSSTTRPSLVIPSSSHLPSSLPLPSLLSSVDPSDGLGLNGSREAQKRESTTDKRRRTQSESGANRRPAPPDPSSVPRLPTTHQQIRSGTESTERTGERLSRSRLSEAPPPDLGRDLPRPPSSRWPSSAEPQATPPSREKYHPKQQPTPIKGMSPFAYKEEAKDPEFRRLRRRGRETNTGGATCWTVCLAALCLRRQ